MSNLAIIPARGGSQRIPGKNIKDFLGKPIIAYSIETALKSGLFDEVMVSTDNKEIAEVAKRYGAHVPFYRSQKNSDNFATTADVIEEVLNNYMSQGREFKLFCCIYPTAPMITSERIKEGYELLVNNNFDSVFPVTRFGYPIFRALKIENSKASMIWPENLNKRSQDLMPAYHDAGQFYWMQAELLLKKKAIFTGNSGVIVLSETEVQDIDNEDDWKVAEMKYKLIKKV
jgi:pseudaminic acid cytidylyltransferase